MSSALSDEGRRLNSGQHTFNVRLAGSGPPLLLLHGFTGSSANWLPLLPRLAAEHHVLALDLIGHGDSDAPTATAAYAMDAAVHDLATLLDALRVPRADVLGYSMGARVALAFAVHQPARVRRLVLESGSPGLADEGERGARRASDERLAEMLERDGVQPFIDFWEGQPLFASQASLPPARREELRRQRLRNSSTGLAGSLRGMGTGSQASLWDRLPDVQMPALVL
ncbi:MAG: 2-succinyl-6-hydroxy-2,4-cyclohexadiene-1-carboxylate synthase, partial [Chloroflexota bacterium]